VYDTKGRFVVHRISREEASYKLCKVGGGLLGAHGTGQGQAARAGSAWREGASYKLCKVGAMGARGAAAFRGTDASGGRGGGRSQGQQLKDSAAPRLTVPLPPAARPRPRPSRPQVKRMQAGKGGIPYIATHDGRTLRYPDPNIKVRAGALGFRRGCPRAPRGQLRVHPLAPPAPSRVSLRSSTVRPRRPPPALHPPSPTIPQENDTVVLDLETGKVKDFAKFDLGNLAMVRGRGVWSSPGPDPQAEAAGRGACAACPAPRLAQAISQLL
jgi:hypothetical protein